MSVASGQLDAGSASRRPAVVTSLVVGAALVFLGIAVVTGSNLRLAAVPIALVVFVVAAHERLFAWHSLLALIVLTILIVPIRRYTLPASLPFQLEPYRIIVAAVALAWLTSLLIDPRVRLRASGLEGPVGAFLLAILLSIVFNLPRVEAVGSIFAKSITFFLSFFVVFYAVVGLARRPREIDFLARLLTAGGAFVGACAVIESRMGYNPFDHMKTILPFLEFNGTVLNASDISRGGRLRVLGSAQHPIAMGAAFAILLPLAVYCACTSGRRRWWLAAGLIFFGALATQSRTAIIMLFASGVCFVVFYPRRAKRLSPLLLPALVIVHLVLPGTLGTMKDSFFPQGGLIQQQANTPVGSGRVATLGPVLRKEFLPNPMFGEGFGTRVTVSDTEGATANAPITDDQWLSLLATTGVAGTLAFLWIFVRGIRRMGRAARRDRTTRRGWLLAATTASAISYGVGLFTYDAFSFIQVTFLFFIILGLGVAALHTPETREDRSETQSCLTSLTTAGATRAPRG